MPDIIPPNIPEPAPAPAPEPELKRSKITCECCGSQLDRHGNLLRRGDLAKQMIDAEDRERELRKQLTKATEDLDAAKATIAELKAAQPGTRKPLWQREA